ncbi:hypothetical protein HYN48_14515 [Flavobacterium magnum]|uniref:Uncharacterized protein n=1 Tax=Flavobacterium magnum TaxID=2162713 RepID=A0A2S0RIV8_9FLAO|nr:hypothetical protein HYN48_14515 [Flavobacterium magnum]
MNQTHKAWISLAVHSDWKIPQLSADIITGPKISAGPGRICQEMFEVDFVPDSIYKLFPSFLYVAVKR